MESNWFISMNTVNPSTDTQHSPWNAAHPSFTPCLCSYWVPACSSLTMIADIEQVLVLIKKRHLNSVFHMRSHILATPSATEQQQPQHCHKRVSWTED